MPELTIAERLAAPAATSARVVARAAGHAEEQRQAAEEANAPSQPEAASDAAEPAPSVAQRVMSSAPMQAFGRVFNVMTSVEQTLSAPLAAIPFPGFPAVTVGTMGMGLPHAHAHPPNFIPPAPPVPYPHLTAILSIPILSGATSTLIANKPAARCGDMGAEIWCGGYFPFCEIFLGSSSVWIEGARAARQGVDITKHCVFSSPRPTDPPLGPMVGFTMQGEPQVLIGGVPVPSLTNLAMGAAFKGLFTGAGMAGRAHARLSKLRKLLDRRAAAFVSRMEKSRVVLIYGDAAFQKAVRRDLMRLARTRCGRELMNDIARTRRSVDICPPSDHSLFSRKEFDGPYARPFSSDARLRRVPDPNGPLQGVHYDELGRAYYTPGETYRVIGNGAGSSSAIVYDPTRTTKHHYSSGGTTSDVILAHEMNHSRNNALGRNSGHLAEPSGEWQGRWRNLEEHDTVGFENQYRKERSGIYTPKRKNYSHLPSWGLW
jgi:uncharacterized Zn-binding protein involved in type VI secretion